MAPKHEYVECKDSEEESSQGLLDNIQHTQRNGIFRDRIFRPCSFALIQIFLLFMYTATFFWLTPQMNRDQDLVYSPAQSTVRYERVSFNATLVIDSPYNGEPSAKVDQAWTNLLQYMNIAVSKSDLDKIGADSIKVPGEEGEYIAGLGVYHELHCLKRLRQYTWKEYYHANATDEENRLNRLHTDHCIDVLRQAILCRSDISLFTVEWSEGQTMPRADFSHEHTCKDWRRIFEWAGKRSIPEETMKSLKHPLYGSAFPDGKGSELGATEDKSAKIHE